MNRSFKLGAVVAALIVTGAGVYAGAAHLAAGQVKSRLMASASQFGLTASIGKVTVNPLTGAVALSAIEARNASGARLRIGKVTRPGVFALATPAYAQATSSYTMDDVEIVTGFLTLSAEELVVEDATLDEDGLQDLFDSDSAKDVLAALKTLSFKAIRSPELVLEQTVQGAQGNVTYKDVSLERMRNGRLERMAALSASTETKTADGGTMKGTIGLYEARGLDVPLMIRFFIDKAAPGETLATAYESSRIENYRITQDGIVDISIGRMETGAVRLKAMSVPITELIAGLPQNSGAKLNQQQNVLVATFMGDLFNSISDDGVEIRDIKVGGSPIPDAGASIARIHFSFGGGKVPAGFGVEGMSITGAGSSVKLASLSSQGFSAAPFIEAAIKAMKANDPDFKNVDPRTLLPKIGTYTIKGFEFDVPDPKARPGQAGGRFVGGVGLAEFAAKNEIKGIPTDLSLILDKVALRLPANSTDPGVAQIKALGYDALDLSGKAALKWDEAAKAINLTELSLSGVNMGSVRATASLGNVGRDLFEADLAMAQVAALGATAKSVSLRLENTGLAERLFEMQGKATGRKGDDIRAELGSMAALGIPAILGPSDDAKAIANAVARFLARPRTLTLDVTAKNAGGVGLPDMMSMTNPQAALSLINVKASAD